MHKFFIYLYTIHLLKSSTCFEHYRVHLQDYAVIVYMQPLVSSLSAVDCPVHRLRRHTVNHSLCWIEFSHSTILSSYLTVYLAIIQPYQAKILRQITNAPWYVTNHTLDKDLCIPQVRTVLQELTDTHRTALQSHPNPLMAQILAPPNSRRLQRKWTLDVVT
jgi:hypothetical protein